MASISETHNSSDKGNDVDTGNEKTQSDNTRRVLGVKLIQAVREGKLKAAYSLIDEGADICYADTAGWQAIHYAALNGTVDFIIKLLKCEASANCYDSNGETPLHKAARKGNIYAMIVLLAHGAVVETVNWKGQSAFELGVIGRNIDVLETLAMFGVEPNLQDWTWTINTKLTKKEERILELIERQLSVVPGFKHGGIRFGIAHLQPNSSHQFAKMGITVDASKINVPFFMYLSKMQSEYKDLKYLMRDGARMFSDTYVCQVWGLPTQLVNMKLRIDGLPNFNERVSFISLKQSIGRVIDTENIEDKNETIVTLSVKLTSPEVTVFGLTLVEEKEKFQISKRAVVLKPTTEPDATISIPENTFHGDNELSLHVVDTKNANEDEDDEMGPLLLTNVIDMSMSDGQQPDKAITMKLPTHSNDVEPEDTCILATSEEDLEDEDDWELIEAQTDGNGSFAVFNIEHFSIYAGTSRKKTFADKTAVIQAIQRSLRKERKVQILVLTRLLEHRGHFELLVEISTTRRFKQRQKRWTDRGYLMQQIPDEIQVIEEEQSFKIRITGNLKEISNEEDLKLNFVGKRGFKHVILNMVVCDMNSEPEGKLCIDVEDQVEVINPAIIVNDGCFARKKRVQPKQTTVYSKLKPFVVLPVAITLPEVIDDLADTIDIQSFISGDAASNLKSMLTMAGEWEQINNTIIPELNSRKLVQVASGLTSNEGIHLGHQLLSASDVEAISRANPNHIGARVLLKFRGKHPHQVHVNKIAKAFCAINRKDLASQFIKINLEKTVEDEDSD